MWLKPLVFAATALVGLSAQAQSSILIEACNNIENSAKRLVCLQEATKERPNQSSQKSIYYPNLKRAFISVQGAVGSGISFRNYQNLILEPAKELANFNSDNPGANVEAIALLEKALVAYKDAETLWNADIFSSQDAGLLFGRILPYERLGLGWLIARYDLPTTSVLLNKTVSASVALPKIWSFAEKSANSALAMLNEAEKNGPPTKAEVLPVAVSTLASAPSTFVDGLNWIWPGKGSIIGVFDGDKNRGLDIDGSAGDPVIAVANGVVVFARAGLNGYGKLIILKHNNSFLTAYAHNQALLVTEGQVVNQGQKIAEMGSTEADRVKLHFEVRRQGNAVDPMKYLPAR